LNPQIDPVRIPVAVGIGPKSVSRKEPLQAQERRSGHSVDLVGLLKPLAQSGGITAAITPRTVDEMDADGTWVAVIPQDR
jgi:hypothetical protein